MISPFAAERALTIPAGFDPELLEELIDRAVAFVEQQTHRYFGPLAETTEVLTGNGTRHLRLGEVPVVVGEDPALATVTEQQYQGDTAVVLTAPDDFVVRTTGPVSHLVRAGGGVWTLGAEYLATYTRGYPVDAGPKDIEQLVIALMGIRIAGVGLDGLSGETIGGYAFSRPAIHAFEDGDLRAIPGAVRTIAAWRQPVFA